MAEIVSSGAFPVIAAAAGDDDLALDLHSLFDLGLRRLTDCLAMFVDEHRK